MDIQFLLKIIHLYLLTKIQGTEDNIFGFQIKQVTRFFDIILKMIYVLCRQKSMQIRIFSSLNFFLTIARVQVAGGFAPQRQIIGRGCGLGYLIKLQRWQNIKGPGVRLCSISLWFLSRCFYRTELNIKVVFELLKLIKNIKIKNIFVVQFQS